MRIAYFLCLAFLLANCQNSQKERSTTEAEKYPGDWLYEQRAYPYDSIPYTFINQEYKKLQQQTAVESRAIRRGDWKLVGPKNVGGRVTSVALNPNDTSIFFIGTATGGIFKTTDRGASWQAVFDESGRLSIGDLEIAPSNTKILYAGTGEANASATSGAFFGDGIYKSENGGKSWENIGLENSHHIGKIIVNPTNENHVLVAAAGPLYSKGGDRGFYETRDGGESWNRLLFVSDSTACINVIMHPQDSNTYYAVTWERVRQPWQRSYAGETSRIYRTRDAGATWEILNSGLPNNIDCGRMGLAISPSDPNILYVSVTENKITNTFNGLYKSIDGGDNWFKTTDFLLTGMYNNFGWYFGQVRVAPEDPNRVYTLGVALYQTNTGGNSWERIARGVHVDHHALETHPKNTNMVVLGNDGGAYVSVDRGATWTHLDNLPITQLYECEVAQSEDDFYYGGTQDNGTIMTDAGVDSRWRNILGGDGFHVIVEPENSDIVYAEYQWGNLFRSVNGGASFQWALSGIPNSDRTNWNTPIAIDPSDYATLYYGSQRLYRSTNRAASWEAISNDLTKGLHPSGSTRYATLSTIAVSSLDSDIIWTGSDDGNVQMTTDGGETWNLVSDELPDRFVTSVFCDLEDPMTAYVTYSGYRFSDYLPHIFWTQDGGLTWEDISANLPEVPINDVIADPKNPDRLFVATDMGVWQQDKRDQNWTPVGKNLPATVISDLVIHQKRRMLIAATYGRSLHEYPLDFVPTVIPTLDSTTITPLSIAPNPVRDVATIEFELQQAATLQIGLYDMSGKMRQQLPQQRYEVGAHQVQFTLSSSIVPGLYVVRVASGKEQRFSVLKVVE
ncbi:MAG: T9SS type A sorting domain-containing protein [Bacteroidota bacterium]